MTMKESVVEVADEVWRGQNFVRWLFLGTRTSNE